MQEVEIYTGVASIVYVWANIVLDQIMIRKDKLGRVVHWNKYTRFIYDTKPFNCGTCLSFWIGLIITLCTFNLFFLSLPLSYKLLNKMI